MEKSEKIDKNVKYLAAILSVLSVLVIFHGVIFKQKPIEMEEITVPLSEIKIDFNALDSNYLSQLVLFKSVSLPKEIGRPNPFAPCHQVVKIEKINE